MAEWADVPPLRQRRRRARIGRLNGKTTRPGLRKCYECRKPFTVRMGSIFEDSHLPLRLWLQAIHLLCVVQKRHLHPPASADAPLWHENRVASWPPYPPRHGPRRRHGPLGGAGKTVEADETALTKSRKTKRGRLRRSTHTRGSEPCRAWRQRPFGRAGSPGRRQAPARQGPARKAASLPIRRRTTFRPLRSMKALTIPSMNGRAATFTPTRWKALLAS